MIRRGMGLVCAILLAAAMQPLPTMAADEEAKSPRVVSPCESASEWRGAIVDTSLKKAGNASITWDLSKTTSMQLKDAPKDWSSHNSIRFWVHNKKPGKYYFYMIFFSENKDSQGPDYYSARVNLNFQGWRRFTFRRKFMGKAREPHGWDQISNVLISTTWGDQKIDPTMQFHIDEVELVDTKQGDGPRVTDEEMIEAFDLTREGMEAVKAAADKSDWAAAKHALAEYMRNRKIKTWTFDAHEIDRNVRYNKERADKAIVGDVRVCGVDHAFPDGKIDWAFNATDKRDDMAYNPEWQWQLGRMWYWKDMGNAYWATGDEKYAEAWARQLRSWVKNCPMPDTVRNSRWSSWRTIECGIRMAHPWPRAFHHFLLSPHTTDDVIADFIKSTIEHGRYLEMYPSSTGNWLALETEGLYTIGVIFPELKEAKPWRELSVARMMEVLHKQFLPDGWQYEIATGYSQMVPRLTLSVYRRAQEFGYLDEVPADYTKTLEKTYESVVYFMTPDRREPGVNDSGMGNAPRVVGEVTDLFPERKDFLWVATNGEKGTPPEHTSHAFDHAGYYCMRSGWSRHANFLMLDVGTLGMAHEHQDKLNIVMWAWGKRVLFDSCGYTYDESKWRRYGTSTFAHSTVTVDGLGQARDRGLHKKLILEGPVDARWETEKDHDFAAATFDEGYGKVDNNIAKHTRRVLFVKPDLFVVSDTLESRDGKPHTYQARYQMWGGEHGENPTTGAIWSVEKEEPNLAIVPLLKDGLDAKAATMQTDGDYTEIMGFYYKGLKPMPATTVVHQRKGAGVQQMLTLLVPLRVGESDLVKGVRATGPASAEVQWADGRTMTVEADPDASGGITVTEKNADGSEGRKVGGGMK